MNSLSLRKRGVSSCNPINAPLTLDTAELNASLVNIAAPSAVEDILWPAVYNTSFVLTAASSAVAEILWPAD